MTISYKGIVYRAHNPYWSFDVLSGDGARRSGGRFNSKGVSALYTSMTQTVALAEYHQGFPHRPQPATLCAYEVICTDILDLTDPDTLKLYKIDASDLACEWEIMNHNKIIPPSWAIADRFIKKGIAGIIVPSFAKNSPHEGKNLVFWFWNNQRPHKVTVIDDFSSLPKNQNSWR